MTVQDISQAVAQVDSHHGMVLFLINDEREKAFSA
jgi:hypothetical protein